MIPIGRGQRELVIGDRQTGKTSICVDTILNQKSTHEPGGGDPVYCIYVACGQKMANVARVVQTLSEFGALEYTTIVAASAADANAMQYLSPVPRRRCHRRILPETTASTHWSSTTTSRSTPRHTRTFAASPPTART